MTYPKNDLTEINAALASMKWINTTDLVTEDVRHLYETIVRSIYVYSRDVPVSDVVPAVGVIINSLRSNWAHVEHRFHTQVSSVTLEIAPRSKLSEHVTPAEMIALAMDNATMPWGPYRTLAWRVWYDIRSVDRQTDLIAADSGVVREDFEPAHLPQLRNHAIRYGSKSKESKLVEQLIRALRKRDDVSQVLQTTELEVQALVKDLERMRNKMTRKQADREKLDDKIVEIKEKINAFGNRHYPIDLIVLQEEASKTDA